MPFPEWEEFLDKTVSQVRFRYDRREIRRELTEHLEDARDAAADRGEADPAAAALAAMGDPVELGRALDREHKPLLGWIWRLSRWALALAVLVSVLPALNLGILLVGSAWEALFPPYTDGTETHGEVLWRMDLDQKDSFYNITVKLDELVAYADGSYSLRYQVRHHILDTGIWWSYDFPYGSFTDLEGNPVSGGFGGSSGGIISYCEVWLEDLPPGAEGLIIRDQSPSGPELYFRIEFPKEEGAAA